MRRRTIAREPVAIEPGDLLVIFTDGLPEAVNTSGEEYGEVRLQNRVEHFTNESAAVVLAAVMSERRRLCGACTAAR